ncbi:MAG: DUF2169 domain-containing protein [Acidovorax sp.]|jgi:uncharacterized protein YjbI with pentapeptide repeats|nr:DUF2169 domain-containing protein [Acidovorax sp.]
MRAIKPQQALIHTAPTQFGVQAVLGVSVGCGFRLSDPRVLLHEAGIWQAFTGAPMSTPIMDACLPKQQAEWLLAGHATYMAKPHEAMARVDWEAKVKLQGVTKAVSCCAEAMAWQENADALTQYRASLAMDYCHAMKDFRGKRNPVGMEAPGNLQLMGKFGPVADPLAAMGPMEAQWAARADLAPRRSALRDPFGRDGSHMGWPMPMDLRYFQLAPADQRLHAEQWSLGADFELWGFGSHAQGYKGRLPRLQPQCLLRRRHQSELEELTLKQQTVWFLPDHDMGVLWWHGMVDLDCVLSDEIELGVLALREPEHLLPREQLLQVMSARSGRDLGDVAGLRDADLLPERSRGWIWDLVLSAEDHPGLRSQPLSYEALQARVDAFEAVLQQTHGNAQKAQEMHARMAEQPWKQAEALDQGRVLEDWPSLLLQGNGSTQKNLYIDSAKLADMAFHGVHLLHSRCRGASLSQSVWSDCCFEGVEFAHCDFQNSEWKNCSFVRCRFVQIDMAGAYFSGCSFKSSTFDACLMESTGFTSGKWEQLSLQNMRGNRGRQHTMQWDGVNWLDCEMSYMRWQDMHINNSGAVRCKLAHLSLQECKLQRFSAVSCDLRSSHWLACAGVSVNLAEGSDMGEARLSECCLDNTSWVDIRAEGIQVEHSSLQPLFAQRLQARGSKWQRCILSESNLMHADLSGSVIEACALKNANLYGADLRQSKITHSNLISLQLGMAYGAQAVHGYGNLCAAMQLLPRRQA